MPFARHIAERAVRTGSAAMRCARFDAITLGAVYMAPFISDGVNMDVVPFFWSLSHPCAGPTTFGCAQVDPSGLVPGGSPAHELEVNNVALIFKMADFLGGVPVRKLTVKYSELGGQVNLMINGDCWVLNNFTDLPAGVYMGVRYRPRPHRLILKAVTSTIDAFGLGGQELWIDDICASD